MVVKWPEHENDHSPLCSFKVKNTRNSTSIPPYVFVGLSYYMKPFVRQEGKIIDFESLRSQSSLQTLLTIVYFKGYETSNTLTLLTGISNRIQQNREVTSIVKRAVVIRITTLTVVETKRMNF